jgi:hypothetical protein
LHLDLTSDECLKGLIPLGLMVLHGRSAVRGLCVTYSAGFELAKAVRPIVVPVFVALLRASIKAEMDLPGPRPERDRIQATGQQIKISRLSRDGRFLEQKINGKQFGDGPVNRQESVARLIPQEARFLYVVRVGASVRCAAVATRI